MSAFERYLSVWVALAMLAGLGLGHQLVPGLMGALAALEYGAVNFLVAVLIWVMVYPMMVGVDSPRSPVCTSAPRGCSSRWR